MGSVIAAATYNMKKVHITQGGDAECSVSITSLSALLQHPHHIPIDPSSGVAAEA